MTAHVPEQAKSADCELVAAAQRVLDWWAATLENHLLSHADYPWAEDAEWDQFADLRSALRKAGAL